MSGIVGIVNTDGAPVDPQLLERMTGSLAYRGPDARKVWADGAVGLGHALFRTTVESQAEQQPTTLDGRVWITADARIDGRADLIRQLEGESDVQLGAAPDVELILHAYHRWGMQCLDRLIGDFAFAIWDGRERRLFCARDHFGVRPFFYAHVGHCLVVGNAVDAIRNHPMVTDTVNDLAVVNFLLFWYQAKLDATSFADVHRLQAGHSLTWTEGQGLSVRRYWQVPIEEPLRLRRADEYVDGFRELFDTAVADRLRTSRLAISLSGGMDSSSVAATAVAITRQRNQQLDLHAHTFGYEGLLADREGHYARLAAEHLGIPNRFIALDRWQYLDGWDDPRFRVPEPAAAHLFWKPARMHRERVHDQGIRVCLGGEGGDSHFSQEPAMNLIIGCRWGRLAREVGGYVWARRRLPSVGIRTTIKRWRGTPPAPETDRQALALLNPALASRLEIPSRWWQQDDPLPVHPWRPMSYKRFTEGYWTLFAEKTDTPPPLFPALEWRFPFLDVRLIRFMLRVSPYRWAHRKELLREAMRGRLPEAVRLRPKVPLAGAPKHPCASWVTGALKLSPALATYVDVKKVWPPQIRTQPDDNAQKLLTLNQWLLQLQA